MYVGDRVRTQWGVEGVIVEDWGNMVVIIDDHAETDDDRLEFKKSELAKLELKRRASNDKV